MKKMTIPAVLLFLAMALIGSARAQASGWQIDKALSNIYFDIRHTFAMVRGQIDDFTGALSFNAERLEDGHVEFKTDVSSINTALTSATRICIRQTFLMRKSFRSGPGMKAATGWYSMVPENKNWLPAGLL